MADKVIYNSVASGQIPKGTRYLKSNGSFTTDAADQGAWLRRNDAGPNYIFGVLAGGTSKVILQQSSDRVNVAHESADLTPSLAAGVVADTQYPFFRVKVVQSSAPTTTAVLFVD